MNNGTAFVGDGSYDEAPAEMDPMGGNAGTSNPYVELIREPPPPSPDFDAAQFYHSDALGSSQRVTRNSPETLLGTSTMYPDYIDPRHAEFDGMHNNVGTKTTYVEQPSPPTDPPIPMESEAVFMINGQMVSATQDGLPMSAQALQAMAAAGAVGITKTMREWEGNFVYFVPADWINGQLSLPTGLHSGQYGPNEETLYSASYSFLSLASWAPQRQNNTNQSDARDNRDHLDQDKTCVFNINLKVTDSNLTQDQVDEIKAEMVSIFDQAGHDLVFDNPGAAIATKGGSYDLEISDRLRGNSEEANQAWDTSSFSLIGPYTFGETYTNRSGDVKNSGIASTFWIKKRLAGADQNLNSLVAHVGVHEAAHWFLTGLFGKKGDHWWGYDIMGEGSKGIRNGFNGDQAKALRERCKKE